MSDMNPTMRMDKLDMFGSYSLLRGNREFVVKYDCKHSIFGNGTYDELNLCSESILTV